MNSTSVAALMGDAHVVAQCLVERIRRAAGPERLFLVSELQSVVTGLVSALAHELRPILPEAVQARAAAGEDELRQCLAELIAAPPEAPAWSSCLEALERALKVQRELEERALLPALHAGLAERDGWAIAQAFRQRLALHGAEGRTEGGVPPPRAADLVQEAHVVLSALSNNTANS